MNDSMRAGIHSAMVARCERIYGCPYEEAVRANSGIHLTVRHSMAARYQDVRRAAKARGVGWEITFPEWAGIWRDSGKWEERGIAPHQYVMARHGDEGPYKVGNVSIQLAQKNNFDAGIKLQRKLGKSGYRPAPGLERGWTFMGNRKSRPYQVKVGKLYVGCFATQEEAESAYADAKKTREGDHL